MRSFVEMGRMFEVLRRLGLRGDTFLARDMMEAKWCDVRLEKIRSNRRPNVWRRLFRLVLKVVGR